MPDPRVPGTKADRTGSTGLLRRALREINRRWAGLQAEVLALFDGIGRLQANDAATPAPTIYTLTPQQLAQLSADLQSAVRRWIADDRDPAHQLWWSPYSLDAAQMGSAQTVANLGALSENYAAARSIESVIYSEPFRSRVAMAQIRSYEHWTGRGASFKSELAEIIGRGIADGKNPKVVRAEIMERFGISKRAAWNYAQTDITNTLRETRRAEADYASDEFGIKIGLLWTSSFLPTTRTWHAARNGKVYSTQEVSRFYQEKRNLYRCYCGQTECLLDDAGRPILSNSLKSKMAAELSEWNKGNRKAPPGGW